MKKIIIIGALAVAALSASAVDKIIPLTVEIGATETVQGFSSGTDTFTNIAAPTVFTITNKSLLARIAEDEFFDGYYSQGAFPAGAKLVLMDDVNNFSASYFEVVDKSGFSLVNVSDLLQFTNIDESAVESGNINLTTGILITSYKAKFVAKLIFDDTASASPGGHYKFYLQGVASGTATDSKPKDGAYTEKWTIEMYHGGGGGESAGVVSTVPLIISGTINLTGQKVFSVQ